MNIPTTHWCALIGIFLCAIGCDGSEAFAPLPDGKSTYWELRLNYHAVRLSLHPPYNSLKLETTPYNSAGDVWTPPSKSDIEAAEILRASPAVFVSRDSTKVGVAPDGTVTARAIQSGNVYVVAVRTIGGIEHTDSALVQVADVADRQILTTFRVRPSVTDSAKVAVRWGGGFLAPNTKTLIVTMQDTNGVNMSGYPVYLASSNTAIAQISNRYETVKRILASWPGEVLIRAETWVYGVAKTDSFIFTVGYPLGGDVIYGGSYTQFRIGPTGTSIRDRFDIGPGGHVAWENFTGLTRAAVGANGVAANGKPVDVIFDDPTNVLAATMAGHDTGSGNIMNIPGDTTLLFVARIRMRRFLKAGTYPFTVMPFGVTGKVVVHEK